MSTLYTIIETEDGILQAEEVAPGKLVLHCEMGSWSPRIYKRSLQVWVEVLAAFHERNIPTLFCAIRAEREQVRKFAEMFGFEDYCVLRDEETGEEEVIYRISTEPYEEE